MKKKIFITGDVREYDSADPKTFTDGIEDYIKTKLVDPLSAANITISVDEPSANELRIIMPFTTGNKFDAHTISRELYRCFTGECSTFVAYDTLWWPVGFGPSFSMNVRVQVANIIKSHKANTKYYGADSYKSLQISEGAQGLTIRIKF